MISVCIVDRVHLAIDSPPGPVRRKRTFEALPIFAEKRRTLFVKGVMPEECLIWEESRRLHRSIFAPLRPGIEDEEMPKFLEIYNGFKTKDEHNESDGVFCMCSPWPSPE